MQEMRLQLRDCAPAQCSSRTANGCRGYPVPRRFASSQAAAVRRKFREPIEPCRVTNSEEEMFDPKVPHAYDTSMVNLGPKYQIPNPELGPLQRRVEKTFVEEMFSDEISVEDTQYWFTEPEGGWNSEDVWAVNLHQEQPAPISAAHFAPGRAELHALREGEVVKGTVTEVMYYHGVQVDLGAQFDGLIPVRQEEWQQDKWRAKYRICTGVAEDFSVGQEVTVRIHKINRRPRCRFPIQLTVIQPDVQHKLIDPDLWNPPFDLRGVRSYEEAFAITGRPMPPLQPPNVLFRDGELYDLQQQFQTREGTAEAYGMDSSALENLQVMDNVLEQIASRQKRDQPKLQLEVEDDDDAYEETYSTT